MNRLLLDELADALENKGHKAREKLLPGIARAEIESVYPGVELCDELYQLYGWRNGSNSGLDLDGILFRDTGFLPIEKAKQYASEIIPWYVHPDGPEQADGKFHYQDFDKWVSISGFEGMIYVVICGEHGFNKELKNPILCMGCGAFYVAYDSIDSMIKTCIDWVGHEAWSLDGDLPNGVESKIWKLNNPITFLSCEGI